MAAEVMTMMLRAGSNNPSPATAGFTLIELVLVMALLVIVVGFAAPSLSRSMRQRNLNGEATRFLAATEYARDEAISQGVPMTVWINPNTQRFGVEAKAGYDSSATRNREFGVDPDIHFEVTGGTRKNTEIEAVEFEPDGSAAASNVESVQLADRFNSIVTVARTSDGLSYEILKDTR
jgi:type II secretion system protein H